MWNFLRSLTSSMERSIARSLEPDLRAACDGALGELSWVRMDWQHGGALTGISEFTDASGSELLWKHARYEYLSAAHRNAATAEA